MKDIDYSELPTHMQEGFKRYIEQRVPMGSFGMAVLSNNLREALGRADAVNRRRLFDIVAWLWQYAPANCWGSPEVVRAWLAPKQQGDRHAS